MTAPCKDCTERHPLCHAECPKYIAYRAERDEMCRQRKIHREAETVRVASFAKYDRIRLNHEKRR